MNKYYFTYGTEGHPYYGGWTEVHAGNLDQAIALFRAVHPDKEEGLVNCAGIYVEEDFKSTKMSQKGNFGYYAHEIISITITSCSPAIYKEDEYIDYCDI